ncbi:Rpe Pentose-5-phosphate-3-epimerase [actinobacterium SCGC AAA044-D11]
MIRICPSILNADRNNLPAEIAKVSAQSDLLHLDIMDNIFVPNITFNFEQSLEIIQHCPIPVDAHLMIIDPDIQAERYATAGCASVTFHLEASKNPVETINKIAAAGARVGVALKPNTALSDLAPIMHLIDMVLIMTVEPGFGGQSFMANMMPKVEEARKEIDSKYFGKIWLQVDGGISLETIAEATKAGADTFVAGSAVFKAPKPAEMITALRLAANSVAGNGERAND